jgi:hypothetical protein
MNGHLAGAVIVLLGVGMLIGARAWWIHITRYNRGVRSRLPWRRPATDGSPNTGVEEFTRWFGALFTLAAGLVFVAAVVLLAITGGHASH